MNSEFTDIVCALAFLIKDIGTTVGIRMISLLIWVQYLDLHVHRGRQIASFIFKAHISNVSHTYKQSKPRNNMFQNLIKVLPTAQNTNRAQAQMPEEIKYKENNLDQVFCQRREKDWDWLWMLSWGLEGWRGEESNTHCDTPFALNKRNKENYL